MEVRNGHYGATLVIGSLFVLGLGLVVGALVTAVMLLYTHVPDFDQHIDDDVINHREETHTIAFAIAAAFVSASAIAYPVHAVQQVIIDHTAFTGPVVAPSIVWLLLAGAVFASILTHIVVDALTVGGGYKVEPLWPVSSRTVALGLCTSDDVGWNVGLLVGGATAFTAAVLHELYYSVLPTVIEFAPT